MNHGETPSTSSQRDTTLAGLLAILRRRWLVLAACLIAFPAAAIGLASMQEELYLAEAKVLLNEQSLANSLTDTPDPALRVDRDRLAQTQIEIAKLPVIAERTLRAVKIKDMSAGELTDNVTVTPQSKTDLLVIGVTDGDAERAMRLATMYAAQYTVYRAQLDTAAINRTLREVNGRLAQIKSGNKDLRDSLEEKQAQLRTLQTLQTKNSVIVRRADTATKVQPSPQRDVALSLILGLIIGVALALLLDTRDTRVRDGDDAAAALDVPLIGRIPQSRSELGVSMLEWPAGEDADAYRRVLSNIEFAAAEQPIKTLITVSATDVEGRSELVANMAVGFARAGRKVIALDLDFTEPRLSQLFDVTGRVGISDVAVERVTFEQTVVQIPLVSAYSANGNHDSAAASNGASATVPWDANLGLGSLDVLPSGSVPTNPSDFVGSAALRSLLERLRSTYDVILIDAPGLLRASDASRLCQHADAALIATSVDGVRRDALVECATLLRQTPARLIGMVSTNDSDANRMATQARAGVSRQPSMRSSSLPRM